MPRKDPSSDTEAAMKKRRKRTAFNHIQQGKLETAFQKDHWPTRNKKERMAVDLDMTLQSVRTWFQNRRAKEKREEDFREVQSVKQKTTLTEKKQTDMKTSPQMNQGDSIKLAASGSPGRLLSASHSFMTRSKVKKQERVKELREQPIMTSGSDVSERTTDDDEDASTAEEDDELQEAEKSCSDHSSDSCTDDNSKNNGCSGPDASKRFVKPCQTEGDIVVAKHTPRVTADMFTSLIEMMAVVEGGIIKPNDSSFAGATNHALYGIQLKGGATLFYDKSSGFNFEQGNDA